MRLGSVALHDREWTYIGRHTSVDHASRPCQLQLFQSDDAQPDSVPEYQSTAPLCPFSFLLSHMLGFHSLYQSALHLASRSDNALPSADTPHGILRPVARLGGDLVRQSNGQQPSFAPLAGCGSFKTTLVWPL